MEVLTLRGGLALLTAGDDRVGEAYAPADLRIAATNRVMSHGPKVDALSTA